MNFGTIYMCRQYTLLQQVDEKGLEAQIKRYSSVRQLAND